MMEVSEPRPRVNLAVDPGRDGGALLERGATAGDHFVDRVQIGVVVVAQALGLVVDHRFELGQTLRHRKDLVDLLLVLDRGEAHLGMRQHIRKLLGHSIGIDRHWHRTDQLRRGHRPIELGTVGADDRDRIAAPQAKPVQPHRIGADLIEHLRPGPGLPDAEILVAHRRAIAE